MRRSELSRLSMRELELLLAAYTDDYDNLMDLGRSERAEKFAKLAQEVSDEIDRRDSRDA